MNKKAQVMGELGSILLIFVAILVGVILFQVIAQEVGSSTNTVSFANISIGTITDGETYYFTDYRALSDVVIFSNGSGTPILLTSGNYSITNNVVYNGALAVQLDATPGDQDGVNNTIWNVSATAQPLTYIADSGGRAVAGLIAVFFALAIVAVALYPILKSKILG